MLRNKHEPRFILDNSVSPPICLPADLRMSDLMDVTSIEDTFRRYEDMQTGKVHDGAVYYEHLQRMELGQPA